VVRFGVQTNVLRVTNVLKNVSQTFYKHVTKMLQTRDYTLRTYPAAPPPFTSGAKYWGVPHMVCIKEFSPAQVLQDMIYGVLYVMLYGMLW
jgi:hypothetical protein